MDSEKQKDELTALESIYNEEEFSFHIENDLYVVTLKVFINLPENYYFTYKDTRQSNKGSEKVYISHLPPLILLITLPVDYPSTSCAKFTLRSTWLSRSAISKLCTKLDHLWESNKGHEILFTWISFIQSELLEILNIQKCVNINNPYTFYKIALEKAQRAHQSARADETDDRSNVKFKLKIDKTEPKNKRLSNGKKVKKLKNGKLIDQRATSDILFGVNPVQMLIEYNENRNLIEFRKNFYFCKICCMDKLGEHCIQFLPCIHVFCKECISGYFEVKIKEGEVQNIFCPEEKCNSEATPGQIKELVSIELFSKYDSILLNATLDTMTDIIYCPRKSCQYPVSREPNEIMANCPVCKYAFCTLCKAVYHGIEACKNNTVEYQNLVKEYQEGSEQKRTELELRHGKKRLQMLVENAMSENWILGNSQNCPRCNTAIEKSDGCNKMTCWKCKTFFCWTCREKLNHKYPYNHYRDPYSKCFNMLFNDIVLEEDDDEFEDISDISSDEDGEFRINDLL